MYQIRDTLTFTATLRIDTPIQDKVPAGSNILLNQHKFLLENNRKENSMNS